MQPRSFDPPRQRYAPRVLRGHHLDGEVWEKELTVVTLVVAVKANCDGCRDFVSSSRALARQLEVVVMCRSRDDAHEWSTSSTPVVIAPDLWRELDVRSAPFYVLIEPNERRVIHEGVVFGFDQVVEEIAAFLPR